MNHDYLLFSCPFSDLEAPPDAQVVSTTPTPEAFNLESGGILSVDSSDVQREFACECSNHYIIHINDVFIFRCC